MVVAKASEETKRELAAYVAEGSISPDKAIELMTTPLAGEMTEREPHDGYLVLQGGVPEVQEFLGKVWK